MGNHVYLPRNLELLSNQNKKKKHSVSRQQLVDDSWPNTLESHRCQKRYVNHARTKGKGDIHLSRVLTKPLVEKENFSTGL